jgi:hypothetical protein
LIEATIMRGLSSWMRSQAAHAVEHARGEVLDQHVAGLDQRLEDLLALLVLGVEGDGALVVVQHREIEAVHVRGCRAAGRG